MIEPQVPPGRIWFAWNQEVANVATPCECTVFCLMWDAERAEKVRQLVESYEAEGVRSGQIVIVGNLSKMDASTVAGFAEKDIFLKHAHGWELFYVTDYREQMERELRSTYAALLNPPMSPLRQSCLPTYEHPSPQVVGKSWRE